MARLMIPRLFGIGIGQINLLVDTRFATAAVMPPGSLTALYLADRVMELVLGGYAIAVATAILPMMSHQVAANDFVGLKKTLTFSVRIVAFITIPAMLGLMILREPIIRVLFQHGQFVAASTRITARALLYYAIALPGLATVKLIVPAFYSTRDTRTPVIVAAISMVINILLNFLFLKTFVVRAGAERGSGIGDSAGVLFRFLRSLYYFSVAAWRFRDPRDFILVLKGFLMFRGHGGGLLVCGALHGIYDVFEGLYSNIGFRGLAGWRHRFIPGNGLGIPVS